MDASLVIALATEIARRVGAPVEEVEVVVPPAWTAVTPEVGAVLVVSLPGNEAPRRVAIAHVDSWKVTVACPDAANRTFSWGLEAVGAGRGVPIEEIARGITEVAGAWVGLDDVTHFDVALALLALPDAKAARWRMVTDGTTLRLGYERGSRFWPDIATGARTGRVTTLDQRGLRDMVRWRVTTRADLAAMCAEFAAPTLALRAWCEGFVATREAMERVAREVARLLSQGGPPRYGGTWNAMPLTCDAFGTASLPSATIRTRSAEYTLSTSDGATLALDGNAYPAGTPLARIADDIRLDEAGRLAFVEGQRYRLRVAVDSCPAGTVITLAEVLVDRDDRRYFTFRTDTGEALRLNEAADARVLDDPDKAFEVVAVTEDG